MLFKAFRIKNYKSFIDSGECSVQNGVTIFAGQNESGKSNVLSALVKINDKTPTFNTDEYCFGQTESPEIVYNFELSDAERSELAVAFPDVEIHNDVRVVVKDKNAAWRKQSWIICMRHCLSKCGQHSYKNSN